MIACRRPFPASCSVVTPASERPLKWTSSVSSPAKIVTAASKTFDGTLWIHLSLGVFNLWYEYIVCMSECVKSLQNKFFNAFQGMKYDMD